MTGVFELRDLILEVEDEAILSVKILPEPVHVRLQTCNARSDCHGGDLPGKVQLVIWVRRNNRKYFIGKVKIRAGIPTAFNDAVVRHLQTLISEKMGFGNGEMCVRAKHDDVVFFIFSKRIVLCI